MEVLRAIYQRRATRHFTDAEVTGAMVGELIRAAAQAPSALNQQPWAFAVLHGRKRLAEYSERAKAHLLRTSDPAFGLDPRVDQYANPRINIFHGADTLIVICAKPGRFFPAEDCFLAAENLMLAAEGSGLGSCPVGFARAWFQLPDVKAELGIRSYYAPVLPIVVGHPAVSPLAVPKREPEIACWHWGD
jgi:nitroreductase